MVSTRTLFGIGIAAFAIIAILVIPWYPTSTIAGVTQSFTATTNGLTTQTVTVYNLPNPVNLPTVSGDGVFYGGFLSQSFTLQPGIFQ